MGCGKTTAGKSLAVKLNRDFVDMDEYIVKKEGMTIPEIFKTLGEDYFRGKEAEAVKDLALDGIIVACGGGAMLRASNFSAVRMLRGVVAYIELDFEACYSRIAGDANRPLVTGNTKEQLKGIYELRAPIYSQNCSLTIDGNRAPDAVADEIIKVFKLS